MTVRELIDKGIFETVTEGDFPDTEITKCFCCDLLSVAMGKAPDGALWVTVVSNMNTLAVASLRDSACVILSENVEPNELVREKASEQGIALLRSPLPSFDTALRVWQLMEDEKNAS